MCEEPHPCDTHCAPHTRVFAEPSKQYAHNHTVLSPCADICEQAARFFLFAGCALPPPPMCSSTSLSWEGEECAACRIRGPCCGSASVMSSSTRVSLMLVLSQARSGSKRSPLQRHRRPVARLSLQPPREPPWLIRRGHIKSEHASIRMFSIPSKCLSPCAS